MDAERRVPTYPITMTTRQALDDQVTGHQAQGVRADEKAIAFRQLATGQLSDSYRLASAILGGPSEARDAVHDAFITAWRKWDTLRDQQRFEAWFGRIVVNTCRDRLRRRSRLTTDDGALAESLPAADPIAPIHERMRIEEGLARLKADDQVLLALRYYRDLKVDDIAALLEIPSGTVMSRLHNAQRRLRSALDEADTQGTHR